MPGHAEPEGSHHGARPLEPGSVTFSLDALEGLLRRLSPAVGQGTWSRDGQYWITQRYADVLRRDRAPLARIAEALGVEAAYLRSILPQLLQQSPKEETGDPGPPLHWILGDLAHPAYLVRMREEWRAAVRQARLLSMLDFCRDQALQYTYVEGIFSEAEGGREASDLTSLGSGGWYITNSHLQTARAQLQTLLRAQQTPKALTTLQEESGLPEVLFAFLLREQASLLRPPTAIGSGQDEGHDDSPAPAGGFLSSNTYVPHIHVRRRQAELVEQYATSNLVLLEHVDPAGLLPPGTMLAWVRNACPGCLVMRAALVSPALCEQFEAALLPSLQQQGWVDAEAVQFWPLHPNDLEPLLDVLLYRADLLVPELRACMLQGTAIPSKEEAVHALQGQHPLLPPRLVRHLVGVHHARVLGEVEEARRSVFFRPAEPVAVRAPGAPAEGLPELVCRWACHWEAAHIFTDRGLRTKLTRHLLQALGRALHPLAAGLPAAWEAEDPVAFHAVLAGCYHLSGKEAQVALAAWRRERVQQHHRDLQAAWGGEMEAGEAEPGDAPLALLLACLLHVHHRTGHLLLMSGKFVPHVLREVEADGGLCVPAQRTSAGAYPPLRELMTAILARVKAGPAAATAPPLGPLVAGIQAHFRGLQQEHSSSSLGAS